MKQETLEEAAEKYAELSYYNRDEVDAFVSGAKWKAERMYSEEDMIEFAFNTYCYISGIMKVQVSENKIHAMENFEQFKKK